MRQTKFDGANLSGAKSTHLPALHTMPALRELSLARLHLTSLASATGQSSATHSSTHATQLCPHARTGVTLFGALAESASFVGANLSNADMESGNFEKADFTNAVLAGALFTNTQVREDTASNPELSQRRLRAFHQHAPCARQRR